ncbi:MAG: patatin-like phospholipase family protein [candidate division KSB1 bacterium]|nr:patatin-like phospholipase family protein [candidate division KSB1 bacterium]MDZ7399724.1 patatin-like phospholipase family protein [candidate division KSB1 bacterium]
MARHAVWVAIFTTLLMGGTIGMSHGQEPKDRPKIGLALSGGGAKGLAHIGVLKVLEQAGFPIDYIAGTSMGSVVGALYAIGYRADELKRIALSTNWEDLLTDEVSRRYVAMEEKIWDGRYIGSFPISNRGLQLPSGLIAGQKISKYFARLTWSAHHINDFRQLPIPFICVATDIATGEAVPIDSGFLPDAIRASMAIPTVFTPVKLHDRLLVDGGLVRNLPAEDVKRLGADIIIGVDVSFTLIPEDQIKSFLDIITQSLSFVEAQSRERQRALCHILIQPDISELSMFSFNKAEEIIRRGEVAAEAMLPIIRALMDSLNIPPNPPITFLPPQVDSIYIKTLKITGLKDVSRRLVLAELNFQPPGWITAQGLDEAIDRLYSSRFFERVTYKLIPSDQGNDLVIRVTEKSTHLFRFGLRYDSYFKAALILNTTFRNLAEHGSNLILDLKLGDQSMIDIQYFIHTGLRQRFGLHANANHSIEDFDIYEQKQRTSNIRATTVKGELVLGSIFSTIAIVGFGMRGEYIHLTPRIGSEGLDSRDFRLLSLYSLIWMDTFNHAVFPTRGQSLKLTGLLADRRAGSNVDMNRLHFDYKLVHPVHRRASLLLRCQLGAVFGENIPLNYKFYLGGADSFDGLKYQERSGDYLQAIQAGVQFEFMPKRFLQLRASLGNTSDRWNNLLINRSAIAGFGTSIGAITPIGPIELTVMGGSWHRLLVYFNLGYKF